MRTLYYVPIVHQLRETPLYDELTRRKASEDLFAEFSSRDHAVERGWGRFMRTLSRMQQRGLRVDQLRLYCDGTLQNVRDEPIVPAWREKTPNAAVIIYLRSLGAQLYGTEQPAAYGAMMVLLRLSLAEAIPQNRIHAETARITRLRDMCIALYINDNLPEDGTGMLFIGSLHKTDEHLRDIAPDIRIRYIRPFKNLT